MKMKMYFILTFYLVTLFIGVKFQCYKDTYDRGVGKLLSTCPNGTEMNGALCYNKCQSGYQGLYDIQELDSNKLWFK